MTHKQVSLLILCNNNTACLSIKEILGSLPFDLTICSTLEESLDILDKSPQDIILTEYKVSPSYTGIDFLRMAARLCPASTRLIVGEKTNEEEIVKSVIKGITCAYIDSSYTREVLRSKLVDLARLQTSLDNDTLRLLNVKTNNFPIVMSIYEKLMNSINTDASIGQIASLLSSDVTLTSKILQVANSAFYGSFTGSSVEKAVIYMGLNTVRDIVLMHSLSANLNMTSHQNASFEATVRHSTTTNYYMQQITRISSGCNLTPLNNSVGIIHDIGKIIQMIYFQQEYKIIEDYREENTGVDYYTCEINSGNAAVNHADIGAYFLKLWNFNQYAIEAALFHHAPEEASDNTKPCIEALYLANVLSDIRDGYDLSMEDALARCTILKPDFDQIMEIPEKD